MGGRRDPLNFWDFYDTPDTGNVRDRAVNVSDIGRVVGRFGATGDPGIDPLSFPPDTPAYHTAFDRGGLVGPNIWNLGPPNGAISVDDLVRVVGQFGHSCLTG